MGQIANTTLPHFDSLDSAITSIWGNNVKVTSADPVSGGDINRAYRLRMTDGTYLFMKANDKQNESFFTAEAAGLDAIARTGAVGTPQVFCSGTDEARGGYSFLLMEYIQAAGRTKHYWETFAHELAAMHHAPAGDLVAGGKYGFGQDNYIGRRVQRNTAHDSWTSFFRDCRLEPQFRHATHYFSAADLKRIDRLLTHLDEFLIEPEHPSLLHGDLWSGNVIMGNDGKAWMIDPAVYVGHPEADLAMTELFGGFPQAFYNAYREAGVVQEGYERRKDLYNLYQLLNHLNMFGQSYYPAVRRIVGEYVS